MDNGNLPDMSIPDKIYFKIGEVSTAVGIPTYVLRFWESEFYQIRPKRTASGQRLYRKKDIELITIIKDLLYNKKFTIPGAKRYIKSHLEAAGDPSTGGLLNEIRSELEFLRDFLD
jgi:DNA-binding transcriptional MerR regulator